jgi:hypothetical protein
VFSRLCEQRLRPIAPNHSRLVEQLRTVVNNGDNWTLVASSLPLLLLLFSG